MVLGVETCSRRGFVKLAGASAASLLAGGVLAGCSGEGSSESAESAPQQADQVIVAMNMGSEPAAGFDPFVAWGCGEHVHEPLIQSTLITTDENMDFVYDLATDYHCDPDGMTWHFTIRDDALFSDGVPLTAHDVVFTINGIINAEAAQADLTMVKEAVALSDVELELHMVAPHNALLYTLAVVGIVPAHAYGADYGSAPIGSGRYMLEQWDRGQQVILVANPHYYGDAPAMKRVVIVFMEEDAALAAVKAKQVDIAYTAATYSDQVADGYELVACASVDSRGISLPTGEPGGFKEDGGVTYPTGNDVTKDLSLRRAMNRAVDRQMLIDHVLNGYGVAAYSVGDGLPWCSEDMRIETDVDGALALLEDAGWLAGADGVREKDGVRAAFDLYYSAGDSVRQAMASEFANQMAAIGIEVNVKGASWDDIYPNQYSSPILWGWGSNSPTELYQLTHSEGWGNYACYENAAVDSYLEEALAVSSFDESFDLWKKAQWDGEQGIAPQGASTWIWLANIDHLYFKRAGLSIGTQKPHPHGHGWSLVNNVDRWSWA